MVRVLFLAGLNPISSQKGLCKIMLDLSTWSCGMPPPLSETRMMKSCQVELVSKKYFNKKIPKELYQRFVGKVGLISNNHRAALRYLGVGGENDGDRRQGGAPQVWVALNRRPRRVLQQLRQDVVQRHLDVREAGVRVPGNPDHKYSPLNEQQHDIDNMLVL